MVRCSYLGNLGEGYTGFLSILATFLKACDDIKTKSSSEKKPSGRGGKAVGLECMLVPIRPL